MIKRQTVSLELDKYKNLKEIGLEAREYAKQFSWEEYGARMVKHFEETLKTPETQPQGINTYTSIKNYTTPKVNR